MGEFGMLRGRQLLVNDAAQNDACRMPYGLVLNGGAEPRSCRIVMIE